MAVSLKKVEKEDLPAVYRAKHAKFAFQVTADDGQVFYLDSEEDAAALVAKLHLKDKASSQET